MATIVWDSLQKDVNAFLDRELARAVERLRDRHRGAEGLDVIVSAFLVTSGLRFALDGGMPEGTIIQAVKTKLAQLRADRRN